MATAGVPLWSTTAANNGTADPTINMAEGMAPSAVNDSCRALMASVAKWRDDLYGITTGGTSTAYTIATGATFSTAAAMSGAVFTIIPHATNGASPTLAVDGLTARAINYSTGVAVSPGALQLGTPYPVKYVHASTEFIVLGVAVSGAALTAPATDDEFPIYDLSATTQKRITLADALKVINGLSADATPDVTADYVVTYDASATAAKKVLLQNLGAGQSAGAIWKCITSNGTDTVNDINFGAGKCRDSTNAFDITVAAMGKQLDANWAVGGTTGTPLGMRNSAAGIANGTYHLYTVAKADGTEDKYAMAGVAGTDPDSSAAIVTMLAALNAEANKTGADYVYARRLWSILRTAGASGIVQYKQKSGGWCCWNSPVLDVNDGSVGSSLVTTTAGAIAVPVGIVALLEGNGDVIAVNNATPGFIYLHDADGADLSPQSGGTTPLYTYGGTTGGTYHAGGQARVFTNSSAQFSYRGDGALSTLRFSVLRYYDHRGQDS